MSSQPIPALSVVIMTYNEESNLPRCLESVQGIGDEIFILDSFSTDRTVDIGRQANARVEQHAFGSYVEQKKRLVEKALHDWVLCIHPHQYTGPNHEELFPPTSFSVLHNCQKHVVQRGH